MTDNRTSTGSASGTDTQTLKTDASALKDDAVALKDKAAQRLAEQKDKAVDRLASEADSRKQGVADGMKQVSSALDAAKSELDKNDELPSWIKSSLQQAARSVDSLASDLENKDSRELLRDVQDFARNQPTLFLTACGAVGFAAARVFQAGTSGSGRSGRTGGYSRYGTTGGSDRYGTTGTAYGTDRGYGATGTAGSTGTAGYGVSTTERGS